MRGFSQITFLAMALSLGACSHYSDDLASLDGAMKTQNTTLAAASSPQDIAPAAGGASMGGSMNTMLAREYYDLARFENDKAFDYKAAKQYTKKAMMASKGEMIPPSKISAYDVPEDKIPELTEARSSLIAALKDPSAAENAQTLAKAQVNFDCWLERAEEAADETHYAECKSGFEQAMASIMMPAAGLPTAYEVAFAQNSNIPDPSSANTIEYIAQFLNAPENAAYTASLTGFAASGAQGEFANNLVNARVASVRDALVARGVADTKLKPFVSAPIAGADQANETPKVQVTLIAPQPEFVPVTPVQVQ